MTRIFNSIIINKPRDAVFTYVTTPSTWPVWHPASLSVKGAVDHSAVPGDQIAERIRFMGKCEVVTWTVRERQSPRRWVFDGRDRSGRTATIAYTLNPSGSGTLFERELVYEVGSLHLKLLDGVLLRHAMSALSRKALMRLKDTLENE